MHLYGWNNPPSTFLHTCARFLRNWLGPKTKQHTAVLSNLDFSSVSELRLITVPVYYLLITKLHYLIIVTQVTLMMVKLMLK